MNVHYLQHVPFEGLGSIAAWLRARGHEPTATRFYDADRLPSLDAIDWLIVLGGPMSVHEEQAFPWLAEEKGFIRHAVEQGKGILGICLGAQLLAEILGAKVFPNPHKEIGWFPVRAASEAVRSGIFGDFPQELEVFHWHGETFELPAAATRVASSAACENQGFVYAGRVVALQFHLETTPESARQLIDHCSHELVPAPYIQTAQDMLSDERRFQLINQAMANLLARLAEVCRQPSR
jgi:GMP synthase-like glutamine amidotransferase